MSEFKHWCGNCQIRVYIQRHKGITLTWQDCPYVCEYAIARRCSIEQKRMEWDEREQTTSLNYGAIMRGDVNGD